MGLICHVDLFPVPPGDSPDGSADPKRRSEGSPGHASTSTMSPTPYSPGAQAYPYTYPAPQPPAPYPTTAVQQQQQGGASQIGAMPAVHANHLPQQQVDQQQQQQQYVPNQAPSHATRPDEIVHYFNNTHAIVEGTKQTESLAGTTFVQAANLDYKGNKVLMFVFSVRGRLFTSSAP
jgi:hypothetical protein